MEEQAIITILKTLRSANKRPYDQESLTEIFAVIKSINKNYFSLIMENYYDFTAYLAIMKGEQLAKICRADRDQIKTITALIVNTNTSKIVNLTPAEITYKINFELQREKAGLQIIESGKIREIISKIKILESIRRSVRLISVYDPTMEIYPYCKKYLSLPSGKLGSDLTILEEIIGNTKLFLADKKKAKKIAIDYLSIKNYPLIVLQDKNAESLLNILEKHYLAAMAVLYVKTKYNSETIDGKNILIDSIALFLLDQEDLGETD